MDLPFPDNVATPAWLGHPEIPATTFATLDLPILAPDPDASLLVTVYFQEKQGGFLRLLWKGTGGAQTLTDNFYEGIAMSNQRSLLITPGMMTDQGALSFQSSGHELGIERIKLEWLVNKSSLVSPAVRDTLVTPASAVTQFAEDLTGQPKVTDPAAWHEQIVTIPFTDAPQRIEDGLEFSIQMDDLPKSGRLSFKVAGLPMGQHLVLWINQQRAGTITPAVADLADEGYFSTADGSSDYVGWREGSFFVPVSLLKAGVDTLQFSVEDELPFPQDSPAKAKDAPDPPLALKDLVLELAYPVEQPAAGTPVSAAAPADSSSASAPNTSAPTGEILPLTSDTPTLRSNLP
jgi:hypothetical protein